MRILAEDTMALIVDYQERLMPVIDDSEKVIRNSSILVKGLKILNIPMVVTQQYTKGIGMTVPAICEALGSSSEDLAYYDKVSFSCAGDENILEVIKATGKKNIIVCGTEAHICVLQTVIDLLDLGYNVILVEDCIGSRKKKDRKVAIQRAAKEGAILATYESILFELTRVAKTETFKAISALIR